MNSPPLPIESAPPRATLFSRCLPCLLAFVASFCVMVVELVAGRVIAKHVGASLYTWTSVIGVVLGGITLGNLIGGRLADWFRPRKTLAILFLLAAISCLAIPLFDYLVGTGGKITLSGIKDWPLRIAVHVTCVFLPAASALGLIGPVVAKMALDLGRKTGSTVGNVYAWGALGSIVGTFVTGFYLVQAMGTVGIIFTVSGLLAAVGLALAPTVAWPMFLGGCVLFVVEAAYGPWEWKVGHGHFLVREQPDEDCLYTTETQYSYIAINEKSTKEYRDLVLDNLIHAHYVPGDIMDLRYDYEEIYAAATQRFGADRKGLRALFLGGGGYIFPRYLKAKWPESHIQVAEIDFAVTRADMEAFGLKAEEVAIVEGKDVAAAFTGKNDGESQVKDEDEDEDEDEDKDTDAVKALPEEMSPPEDSNGEEMSGDEVALEPIEIHHMDARNHIEDLVGRKRAGEAVKVGEEGEEAGKFEPFDFVYGDAFNDYAVPFHLITKELTEKVKEILRPETGLYLINIIDIYASGKFLGGVYNTMREVFPHVYVYSSTDGGPDMDEDGRDTFIVIGALRKLDLEDLGKRTGEKAFTGSLLEEKHIAALVDRSGGIVLTDDYAPVENLLEVVVRMK